MIEAYDRIAAQKTAAYVEPQGLSELRYELARHLKLSLGVGCSEEQIVITGGHRQSLALLCRLFSGENRYFAMENPCYDGTRIAMQLNGYSFVYYTLTSVPDGQHTADCKEISAAAMGGEKQQLHFRR